MEYCLANELKRLKESSKEAVENIENFNEFKQYMHVKRNVECELVEILENANKLATKQLILVCGSVGDGKSHLLSYIKNNTNLLDNFYIHNDATESFKPNQTCIEALDEILNEFSDENLENGKNTKIIMAINLGTLNNFIDSEVGVKYKKLKNYIDEFKIFDMYVSDSEFKWNSYFQHINFSDYNIFTLIDGEKNKIKSDYLESIINKITAEIENNYFYKSYKNGCENCEIGLKCPVKHNYEMLKNEKMKQSIISLIIETVIKDKLIISTRAILNFFYDILVHNDFSYEKFKLLPKDEYIDYYLEAITPNLLYKHENLSLILNKINKRDPLLLHTSEVDEIVVKFNFLEDIKSIMQSYLKQNVYLKYFIDEDINKLCFKYKHLKRKILEFFIRSYTLFGIEGKIKIEDNIYNDYIKYLYHFNKGNKRELKNLYDDVKKAIYRWNGSQADDEVNIKIGKNQLTYEVSEKLKIKEHTQNLKVKNESELIKFVPFLEIGFSASSSNKFEIVNIDYTLYKFLIDVKDGYRPNIRDKYEHISFTNFVKKLYEWGSKKEELFFVKKSSKKKLKYILEKNEFGFKFKEIEV